MAAYYNEIDNKKASWLRELIKQGVIAPGDVDERSIEDVLPNDLMGYTQCHFFAGIGIWSYALRKAGWSDDRQIWTGSCPCQPFSAAGKGDGFADERHLWPVWFWLIEICEPVSLLGEQVASKATDPWFDLVQADLEGLDYSFGCVPFPAASVGSPQIRDRAYWLAYSNQVGPERERRSRKKRTAKHGEIGGVADNESAKSSITLGARARGKRPTDSCNNAAKWMGYSYSSGTRRNSRASGEKERFCNTVNSPRTAVSASSTKGFWKGADWLFCRDGKWRPVEPGTFPLANGASERVLRLRGYGDGIVAPQAIEFIKAAEQVVRHTPDSN